MEKLASLGHFAGAAVVGFVHGVSPVPVPDPPIANERGTAHEREHVVGYATGQVGGGFLLGQAGAGIAGGGGAGEVLSGGTATMVAVPVMAVGMTMAVAGSISVSKGLVTLYNEARNHGRGGSASGEAAPQAAPEPAPAASAAPSSAAGGGIRANAAQGKAFEDQVAAEMEGQGWTTAREVTLETPNGARTRMDIVGTRGSEMKCVECKSSATAPLTPGQTAAHPQIQSQGATVMGKGKPNVPGGTQIPPTRVEVRRPE